MDLSYSNLTILSFIQGITEFLPISSSAHLILPSLFFGWPDQGINFDVAVHIGTLFAVVFYFRQDLCGILKGWFLHLFQGEISEESDLAWFILIATLPAMVVGLSLNDYIASYARSGVIIAVTSFVFALLLWYSDRITSSAKALNDLNWKHAIFLGIAQALALIPGTSRAGVTMTAALFCQLSRQTAARISFLMAIPIILGSFLLRSAEMIENGSFYDQIFPMIYGMTISGSIAFACIHYFMRLIDRIGFLPFVLYRIGLSLLIFTMVLFE
mgnify:CR=1 FL=1